MLPSHFPGRRGHGGLSPGQSPPRCSFQLWAPLLMDGHGTVTIMRVTDGIISDYWLRIITGTVSTAITFFGNSIRPRTCTAPNPLYLSWPCPCLSGHFNKWGTESLTGFPRVTQLMGRRVGILTQHVQLKLQRCLTKWHVMDPIPGSKARVERDYEKEELRRGRGSSYQISKHVQQLFAVVLNSRWNCALRVYLEMTGAFSIVTMAGDKGAVLPALSIKDWMRDPQEPITSWIVKPWKELFYSKCQILPQVPAEKRMRYSN